jgi:adenine phosphoribosyltransferase
MAACCELIEKMGGVVVGCAFLMELSFLDGRSKLMDTRIFSILEEQG